MLRLGDLRCDGPGETKFSSVLLAPLWIISQEDKPRRREKHREDAVESVAEKSCSECSGLAICAAMGLEKRNSALCSSRLCGSSVKKTNHGDAKSTEKMRLRVLRKNLAQNAQAWRFALRWAWRNEIQLCVPRASVDHQSRRQTTETRKAQRRCG